MRSSNARARAAVRVRGRWARIVSATCSPTENAGSSEVALAPIGEWIGSAGVSIERGVTGPWTAGLALDRSLFRLDTAHRNGSEITMQRESFGGWNVRFAIAREFHLGNGRKGAPR